MKDAKGHGSDPRGAHSTGVQSLPGFESLSYLTGGKNSIRSVGHESGAFNANGISVLKADAPAGYASHRLLYSEGGNVLGALQITKIPNGQYVAANIFVQPDARRQGVGRTLAQEAAKRYPGLKWSEDRSEAGKSFVRHVAGGVKQ